MPNNSINQVNQIVYTDHGLISFNLAWDRQKEIFSIMSGKQDNEETAKVGYLLFCEHPHVITLGLHGKEANLLLPVQQLSDKGVELFHIDRGGDITYHGPGQIVVYPILNLFRLKLGVRDYISKLEETVILALNHFGIVAGRLSGASGVWIDPQYPGKARKICAVGVKISRGISMHGIAFNVNTDLSYFNLINPCGFTDKGVTSIKKETGTVFEMNMVKNLLLEKFSEVFQVEII